MTEKSLKPAVDEHGNLGDTTATRDFSDLHAKIRAELELKVKEFVTEAPSPWHARLIDAPRHPGRPP